MKKIEQRKIDNIEPGMVLGYDLRDNKGNRLMTENTQLSENDIAKLKQRGITAIHIVHHIDLSNEQQLSIENEICDHINQRFMNHDEVPEMMKLKTLLIDYRIKAIQ